MLKEATGGLVWVWSICVHIEPFVDGYRYSVHFQVGIKDLKKKKYLVLQFTFIALISLDTWA